MIISSNFVQNGYDNFYCDPCMQFEQALVEATITYENEKRAIKERVESARLRDLIMESDSLDIYTEAENNIFARLGKMVVTLAKKFADMCDRIIERLKGENLKGKTSEQKLDKLSRKHPELSKEKIRVLAEEGGLDFKDFESLSKLDDEFYKLMRMAEDSKIDPNSFKGHCKEFEKKVKNHDTKIQTVAAVASAATSILAVGAAIRKYKLESAELGTKVNNAKKEEQKMNQELYKKLKAAYTKADSDADKKKKETEFDNMGKYELLARMNSLRMNNKNKAISKNVGALNKFYMSIVKGVDKIVGSGAGKTLFGDVAGNARDSFDDGASKNTNNGPGSTSSTNTNNNGKNNKPGN